MKPQEKAQELIEKFLYSFINEEIREVAHDGQAIYYNNAKEWISDFDENNNPESTDEYINAKACAMICVDEITDALKIIDYRDYPKQYKYWQEVKSEIEKI